ncbi:unnamed protein product [Chilo suppressalis]|uniref:Uncharacterized protein n=1 Tax=Chilo suppressalis TaxID=168631 RepID=A0ABN8L6M0_CHISP|nr:unnamed protein product [Chilo suppressalis]
MNIVVFTSEWNIKHAMAARLSLLLTLTIIILINSVGGLENGKIKITVGTTAGCSDTVNFITNQLLPTYRKYERFLEIEFVAWGRTRRENGVFTFCQFNAMNCWVNRMHRCSLDMMKGNQTRQLEFMSCEFSPPLPVILRESYDCAISSGLNVVDVDFCLNNPHLDSLDDVAQEAAAEPVSAINFIPYIIINDNTDVNVHNQALRRLSSVICFLLAEDPASGVTECQI